MSAIANAARRLVTRPTGRRTPAPAVRHIEHDYGYPLRSDARLRGVDVATRRPALRLVGRR